MIDCIVSHKSVRFHSTRTGPNGSGKTTLTNLLRTKYDLPLGQYTNPDDIELSLADMGLGALERSRLAQKISKDQREAWLRDGISHCYSG